MKRSQVAQAHSTTYHQQTNGLVERQNRTLVSMLRVYCSRYMDDWDQALAASDGCIQQHGAFHHGNKSAYDADGSRKKHSRLRSSTLNMKGKRTAPQTYVRDVIRRQQDLNDLCRRNTQQAQIRQKKEV